MKFIKKMIMGVVRWAEISEPGELPIKKHRLGGPSVAVVDTDLSEDGMRFQVFNAIGGKVIKTTHYNTNTDRSKTTLYIITDKEDLGVEIAHIITRESLTR